MKTFEVKDCALLMRMSGLPPAMNLRELRDRVAACGENVLYHHFCETTLRPTFDDPDYRNDFAAWARLHMRDRVLAERLGIINPYAFDTIEQLRAVVLDIIDDRLGEVTMVPWVRSGNEFQFMEAITVIFDTGERIRNPRELAPAILKMTDGSIYYHFMEALRRPPLGKDDFSFWLSGFGDEYGQLIRRVEAIDFYFYGLVDLRRELALALTIEEEA
jgi:hypothetical protein